MGRDHHHSRRPDSRVPGGGARGMRGLSPDVRVRRTPLTGPADRSVPVPSPERVNALPTTEEVTRMSVLKLQTIEPRTENSSAVVLSITSSLSSTCCR
ncbi:class III lanthipeptide [Streptomyces sp. NPDC005492]|uniref:class III lanthipeptide n=1 Tax=Streptomyces sp. NPDC005492 TaxID=3156883 RepID=UPI00339FAE8E